MAMERMMKPASKGSMFVIIVDMVILYCYSGRMKRIYLDYAAITPIDKRVSKEMRKYSRVEYGNPSAWYREGVAAREAIARARAEIAASIGAHSDEMIFTSGGTEANNIAILGVIEALRKTGVEYHDMHILMSAIEHSSVRECFAELSRRGAVTDEIAVDDRGIVSLDDLKTKIKPNTVLISVMMVNNETGAIQPVREITKIIRQARKQNLLFHSDASQAIYQELNVDKLGVDLLTLDASKMYGPRSIGALFVRRGTPIAPIVFGGGQENGLRSGTENLPGIMGFAKAVEILTENRQAESARIGQLKRYFIDELKRIKPNIKLNGDFVETAPHIANVAIPDIDNEFFVLQLDAKGIACSTKSSCLRDHGESYVLKSMGANSAIAIRFSFGRMTRKNDIKRTIKIVSRLA